MELLPPPARRTELMLIGLTAAGTGLPNRLIPPIAAMNVLVAAVAVFCFPAAPLADVPAMLQFSVACVAVAIMVAAGRQVSGDLRLAAALDPLTGLRNRGALDMRCAELEAGAARDGTSVALILIDIDIDHFKAINESRVSSSAGSGQFTFTDQFKRRGRRGDFAGAGVASPRPVPVPAFGPVRG